MKKYKEMINSSENYSATREGIIMTSNGWGANNQEFARSYGELQELLQMITGEITQKITVNIKQTAWGVKEFFAPTSVMKRFKARWFGVTVPEQSHLAGQLLVEEIDEDFIDTCDDIEYRPDMDNHRYRFSYVSLLASECKQALPGITKETGANRLVAHRWLGVRMRERGMRTKHIKSMLPLAIEAVFIPDKYEVEARMLRQSLPVQNRVELGSNVLQARESPWLLNWFGARRRRPEPSST
jgi:hypothetical protein